MTPPVDAAAAPELPRLHLITDDRTLGRSDFEDAARDMIAAGGSRLALHLRGSTITGRRLFDLGRALREAATGSGAGLIVNDRVDVARAVQADGVQLGSRSLRRSDLPDDSGFRLGVGASVHRVEEAREAGPVDWLIVGTLFSTPTHPDRPGAGTVRISEMLTLRGGVPVIGIGGIDQDRVGEVLRAGAHGVAVLRGVWDAPDPSAAIGGYLEALESRTSEVE